MMVFDYYINVDFDKGLATYLVGKRERDKVLSIVCTDNPYAAVWQPAEGTCERFATAGSN